MPRRRAEENDIVMDDASRAYAKAVGQRPRMVRQQRQLTLEDVDATSNREFQDSALSAYARAHWGDFDCDEPLSQSADATLAHLLERALELVPPPHGMWIDLGCAVGLHVRRGLEPRWSLR